jgi:hypothetical protein
MNYFMSCFMSGVPIVTKPTNDLLQLSSMNIMRRDYTDKHCDHRFLFGSATLNGTYPNPLLTAGRQKATASGKRRKPENETNRVVGKQTLSGRLIGGTVKRKRRKRKTRKR